MKILIIPPPVPPPTFQMTFGRDSGWTIHAALVEYAEHHPQAVGRELWREWAKELEEKLRIGL